MLAIHNPLHFLGHEAAKNSAKMTWYQIFPYRLFNILFSPLILALLINVYEKEREKIKRLLAGSTYEGTMRLVQEKEQFCNEVKSSMLNFKMIEFSLGRVSNKIS